MQSSAPPDSTRPTVFLSYASADRDAARQLRDALPGYGLDVWYDESDLGGGDAWDQKIRRQIRDCDFFMPLISAQTERRHEGYFRREWRLAVERTLDMADDHLYLLPVVIDDTSQTGARVPEKFLSVQWLKLPGGLPTPALESLCRRIVEGTGRPAAGPRRTPSPSAAIPGDAFPVEEPGQKVRFWFEVAGWTTRATWRQFKRLPRWIRWVASIWASIALLSHCDSSSHRHADDDANSSQPKSATASDVTPAKLAKLKAIAQRYEGTRDKDDVAKLGAAIAREFGDDDDDQVAPTAGTPLLAIAFTASPGDAAAAKIADSAFAMTYGMIEISHQGQVALTREPLATNDLGAALERARAAHATFVLYGTVDKIEAARPGRSRGLTVQIAKVLDGSIVWSKTYDAAGADPAKIAADINANLPPLQPG